MRRRRKIDRDVIRIGITHAVQVYRGIQASPLRIDPSGNIITLHARITDWCCSETAKCLEFWESGVPLGQGEFPGALDLITKSDKIRPILQSPSDQRSGGFRRKLLQRLLRHDKYTDFLQTPSSRKFSIRYREGRLPLQDQLFGFLQIAARIGQEAGNH